MSVREDSREHLFFSGEYVRTNIKLDISIPARDKCPYEHILEKARDEQNG